MFAMLTVTLPYTFAHAHKPNIAKFGTLQAWTGDSSSLQQALTDHPAPASSAAAGSAAPALKDASTIVSPTGLVLLSLHNNLLKI